ncbi:MAG: acylphosphatase [Candidatus Omnitrophota bacterium]|jgi:acylphosphatase
MKRAHVFYSGQVQGVGFRYTAQDIAEAFGISGWVKNLRDGRVEIVAEGEEKKVKELLDKIVNGPIGYYIRDVDISWEKPSGEFVNFDIRFDI